MNIDRGAIKRNAKASMRETVPKAVLVALIYLVIVYLLDALSFKVTGQDADLRYMLNNWDSEDFALKYYEYARHSVSAGPFASILDLAIRIMSMMLGVGFTFYCLNVSRRSKAVVGNLFDAFGIFFRALWLYIIMYVRVFLWSLLLVVPGIIESYRQRMAVYLMLDNPDMKAGECIRISREMMQGHKWELFVMDLSFIGWAILSAIPFVSIWTAPYIQTSYAGYYNALLGADDAGNGPTDGQTGSYDDAPPVDPPPRREDEKPPWEF